MSGFSFKGVKKNRFFLKIMRKSFEYSYFEFAKFSKKLNVKNDRTCKN
jgi:hypothetical protein